MPKGQKWPTQCQSRSFYNW